MSRDELNTAVAWAKAEGWNPGLHDAEVFWQTDAEGFLAFELDGEVIGTGSVVSYGGKFGFMGLFIIRPDYRGRGLGREFWVQRRDFLLNRLEPGAAIGMDGVFAMQEFYKRGGFAFSHRNLRMQGIGTSSPYDTSRAVPVNSDKLDLLQPIDQRCFGTNRTSFLRMWLTQQDSLSVQYRGESQCLGFGTIRRCIQGWKIGPLFAATPEVADEIFRALNTVALGQPIYLDIPENNSEALKLSRRYAMKECFGCARMYLGEPPELPHEEIYGVTTFELG